MSNKTRIMLGLSAILLIGFISTSVLSYWAARESLSKEIEENTLPLTSDNIYSEIQRDLLKPLFISSLMAHDTFLRDWVIAGEKTPEKVTHYLKEFKERYDTVTSFYVSEATLKYYHPRGIIKTLSRDDPQDEWYFRLRQGIEDYEVNVDTDTAIKDAVTVFINYKMYDYEGELLGATGVGLSTVMLKSLIEDYQTRYNREIYFIDRQGDVALHGASYTGRKSLRDNPETAVYATRILTSPSTSFHFDWDGKMVFLSTRLVPELNWILVVRQVENPSDLRIYQTLINNILVSLMVSAVVLFIAWITLGRYQRRLEEMASTDKLTGLVSRQVMDRLYQQVARTSKRHHLPLSLIMADIDHFKRVNDTYGHPVGDRVIRSVAILMKELTREADVLCRWGGEEFLILLPDCNLKQSARVAEHIRQMLEDQTINVDGQDVSVTLSLGVAELKENETQDSLIARADEALFKAKNQGRNRVEVAGTGIRG
ncbi:sensor domain-containing diguanylate cyclase [Pseudomaricurvus albidus]|uniref:sensor domain-containing diguanylate cyclase n=1 Tax=Pseudomaricurvus albidus TaxID=2842452 RepID=UPI0034E2112F